MAKKNRFASSDFNISSLPTTRKALFKDLYHHSFRKITYIGLLLLLFSLPVFLFLLFMDIGSLGINETTYPDANTLNEVSLMWIMYYQIGRCVGLLLLLPGVAGSFRLIKKICWQEGISFWHDFGLGIKENFLSMLWPTLVYCLLYLGAYILSYLFLDNIFRYVALGLFFIVFMPMYFWYLELAGNYKASLWEYLKNSFFFFLKSMPLSWVFVLAFCLPIALDYLPIANASYYIIVKYVLLFALIIFYYPCLSIVHFLYSGAKFDVYINQENYPEYYRKGLYDLDSIQEELDEFN